MVKIMRLLELEVPKNEMPAFNIIHVAIFISIIYSCILKKCKQWPHTNTRAWETGLYCRHCTHSNASLLLLIVFFPFTPNLTRGGQVILTRDGHLCVVEAATGALLCATLTPFRLGKKLSSYESSRTTDYLCNLSTFMASTADGKTVMGPWVWTAPSLLLWLYSD